MIAIVYNGVTLDVPTDFSLTLHRENLQLSKMSYEGYSVDVELPATAKNIAALDVWGLLDRGQLFGAELPCQLVSSRQFDMAVMQITEVTDTAIGVCLFVGRKLTEILTQQVNRLVTDILPDPNDPSAPYTVFPLWESAADWSAMTTQAGYYSYVYAPNITGGTPTAYPMPAIRLSWLLSLLGTATNVSFPAVDNNLFILANNNYICPQVKTMTVYTQTVNADKYTNTVTNSVLVKKQANTQLLDVLKDCHVEIGARITSGTTSTYGTITVSHADGTVETETIPFGGLTTCSFDLTKGDTIRVNTNTDGAHMDSNWTFSNYTVDETDYGQANSVITIGGDKYISIGILCNMGDFTVKELLDALQWYTGKSLTISDSGFSLVDYGTTAHVDAEITSWRPTADGFGQNTEVTFKGGRARSLAIANKWLPATATLHESIFAAVSNDDDDTAVVDQWQQSSNKNKQVFPDGVVLAALDTVNGVLTAPADLQLTPFENLNGVVAISGRTYDDVFAAPLVEIDGRVYVILDADTDAETGLTEFNAIKIN